MDFLSTCVPFPAHEVSLPNPLMVAVGAGHIKVVEVEEIQLEMVMG